MSYRIPLFNLNFDDREAQAAADTIRGGWISSGPKCAELEQTFARMLAPAEEKADTGKATTPIEAVALTNCTSALHLSCLACGIGPGDEVIVPSLTFVASANCVRYVGATPVFADIVSAAHPNIDPADIERRITPRTRAIVVVHLGGFPADMDAVMDIGRRHGLKVIEDACHGPLSEYRGRKLGTIGHCGTFSFFSNKNISTGEGGMLVTSDPELAARVRLMRSHCMTSMSYERFKGHATAYDVVGLGYNYRMDDIRASIAVEQLKKLPADLERRAEIRRLYLDLLRDVPGVVVPFADCRERVSNYIMPVVIEERSGLRRDAIRERVHAAGIQTSVHYPPVHLFSTFGGRPGQLPVTESVAAREITLPMYAALSDDDVRLIVSTLNQAVNG